MSRRRVAVALAVLVLVSALSTTVARAAQTRQHAAGPAGGTIGTIASAVPGTTTTVDPWPWPIICTEAAFTSYHVDQVSRSLVIHLTGWIRPCPGVVDPGARRSFTLYSALGATLSGNTVPILDPDTQTYTFDVSGRLKTGIIGATDALCLIDGVYVQGKNGIPSKKACVSVDQHANSAVVAPISTTDPRVAAEIQDTGATEPVDPHCGNCL
jgi:hypothetical protein